MGEFGISQPVRRTEDPIFLTGRGQYVDDVKLEGMLQAHVLRSPHAHAAINSIDTSRALELPGVHLILTGADYEAAGLGVVPEERGQRHEGGYPCSALGRFRSASRQNI